MKRRLMYVELKSGYHDDGPAWIGWVTYSKTRKSIYYRGKRLERTKAVKANHFDADTGALYWITGPKKDGHDRHELGHGAVRVDPDAQEEYDRFLLQHSAQGTAK